MSKIRFYTYSDGQTIGDYEIDLDNTKELRKSLQNHQGVTIGRVKIVSLVESFGDVDALISFLSLLKSSRLGRPQFEETIFSAPDSTVSESGNNDPRNIPDGIDYGLLGENRTEKTPEQILDRFNEVFFSGLSDAEIRNELTLLAKQGFTPFELAEVLLAKAQKEQPTEGKAYLDYLKTGLPIPFPAYQQGHTFSDAELEVIKIAVRQFEFDARFVGREGIEELMYPENENAIRAPIETMAMHIAQTAKGILDKLGIVPYTRRIPSSEIRKSRPKAENNAAISGTIE